MRKALLSAVYEVFSEPTVKQLEAYGRFAHNLAAVCVVALVSILFAETRYGLWHALLLLVAGVRCFIGGALLIREN